MGVYYPEIAKHIIQPKSMERTFLRTRISLEKIGKRGPGSSEGERPAEDRVVVGSNPTRGIALKTTLIRMPFPVNPAQLWPPTS